MRIVDAHVFAEHAAAGLRAVPVPDEAKAARERRRRAVRIEAAAVPHVSAQRALVNAKPEELPFDARNAGNRLQVAALAGIEIARDRNLPRIDRIRRGRFALDQVVEGLERNHLLRLHPVPREELAHLLVMDDDLVAQREEPAFDGRDRVVHRIAAVEVVDDGDEAQVLLALERLVDEAERERPVEARDGELDGDRRVALHLHPPERTVKHPFEPAEQLDELVVREPAANRNGREAQPSQDRGDVLHGLAAGVLRRGNLFDKLLAGRHSG